MPIAGKQAVAEYRRRSEQSGLARIELRAPKEDAALLREIAAALRDPARARSARNALRELFAIYRAKGFKELLAAAPLEGVDLERDQGPGRAHETDFAL